MKISVVILHYQAEPFLHLCLDSLEKARQYDAILKNKNQPPTEIIVADNYSENFDTARWKKKFPQVRFIRFDENLGFGKGNNRAVHYATGDYVLLLNPDTVVPENIFEILRQTVREHPGGGITGVRLIDGKGNFLPESKRNLPSLPGSWAKLTGLDKIFPLPATKTYYNTRLQEEACGPNDVFVGAFMFFKRKDFMELGGFDECFFMYGEDIDLSRRFKEAGKPGYYCGKASVVHFKGESTPETAAYRRHFIDATKLYNRKYYGKHALWLNFLTEILMQWKFFLHDIRSFLRKKRQTPPSTVMIPPGWERHKTVLNEHFKGIPVKERMKNEPPPKGALLIFDPSTQSYGEMIQFMLAHRPQQYRYRFYIPALHALIGSDLPSGKGEIIYLSNET